MRICLLLVAGLATVTALSGMPLLTHPYLLFCSSTRPSCLTNHPWLRLARINLRSLYLRWGPTVAGIRTQVLMVVNPVLDHRPILPSLSPSSLAASWVLLFRRPPNPIPHHPESCSEAVEAESLALSSHSKQDPDMTMTLKPELYDAEPSALTLLN